jgi:serine/threonine-protein kinase
MPLASGARIGAFEIIELIGAGGMGEVYRARDARLQRDVALKVLPEHLTADPERLARFQREAQVLAALAHANIAHIYAIEETPAAAGGSRALVLELVEGPTLADRIAQGPLPTDEAIVIAKQIAEALDAAHEQGIVHRDLKPANIKLREDGTVKVLDFGLAKLGSDTADTSSFGSLSPTLSAAFTGAGTILGTAAYMAPEQARGKKVDKRADVWGFGCVLFEMLAGTKAFDGTDATEMIAAVVRGEPAWAALPKDTPPGVVALLRRCLQKDPRQRLRDMGDARHDLEHAGTPVIARAATSAGLSRVGKISWISGALILSIATALGAWLLKPEPERPISRFEYLLPTGQQFSFPGRHMVAISSQGHIAYAADNQLYLRLRDQLVATAVGGTVGASVASGARSPFFSPDGQYLGFYADTQLKKVSITGGAPVAVTVAQNPWGATWEADNTILYGQGPDGIFRVSADGGKGERIIAVKAGESAHGPQLLPDGRTVLFTLATQSVGGWNKAKIVAHALDTGKQTVVIDGGTDARYLPTGHLVYALNGALLAAPFDASALALTGGAVALVEEVAQTNAGQTGAAQFSVNANGTLVYVPETGVTVGEAKRTLVWLDRQKREEVIKAPPRAYRYIRLSHDGTRVASDLVDENRDIAIVSLAVGTLTPLTFEPSLEQYAVWTPNDDRLIFSSSRAGSPNIYWQPSNGSSQMERLTDSPNPQFPLTTTSDGSQLLFTEITAANSDNLMIMSLTGDRTPRPLVATRFRERNAELSPNNRWLAYQSDKSGRDEIWVTPFPVKEGSGEWKLSTEGGTRPAWVSDTELLYFEPTDGRLMNVTVKESNAGTAATGARRLSGASGYLDGTCGRPRVRRLEGWTPNPDVQDAANHDRGCSVGPAHDPCPKLV